MELSNLIAECRQQRTSAQKCLYDRFATSMFLLCRRYLKTDHEAEEAMMNGFLKFFTQLHYLVHTSDTTTVAWIKKIMVNECLMMLRQRNSFLQVVEDLPECTDQVETALAKLNAGEIFRVVTQLPTGYRTVFNLYAIEGYSHKEIAETLDIDEGTSKSQLFKARVMLQALIAKNEQHYVNAIAQ
ncbi:MAG: sigma-70 family RNA polymerase sigma factor [Chitinophagaceae bacterium]